MVRLYLPEEGAARFGAFSALHLEELDRLAAKPGQAAPPTHGLSNGRRAEPRAPQVVPAAPGARYRPSGAAVVRDVLNCG